MDQTHLKNVDDDWSGISAKAERKKRQNRINQRAKRSRVQKERRNVTGTQQPYRIERWRVAGSQSNKPVDFELVDSSKLNSSPQHSDECVKQRLLQYNDFNLRYIARVESCLLSPPSLDHQLHPTATWEGNTFPFSSDHVLLHLIHHNVFRAFANNKAIIYANSTIRKPAFQDPLVLSPKFQDFCDGLTLVEPLKGRIMPKDLQPTSLQMRRAHSSWLNMFPHPRLRDNLIEMEGVFDSADFCNDLFGEIFRVQSFSGSSSSSDTSSGDDDGDDIATGRNGFIVWGDSYNKDSWEVTPGFLRKWSCLLKGCNDLIASSNRWRLMRGEKSMKLPAFR